MLKKLFNGSLYGIGFAIAFIVVVNIYFRFFFIESINESITTQPESSVTDQAPLFSNRAIGFTGSTGRYSSVFDQASNTILSEGDGAIVGTVIGDGKPVNGLKLKLALNGEVMSQWAVTNSQGAYSISVPYGEYRIDGFEIDYNTANQNLAGLIDAPFFGILEKRTSVTESTEGAGIDFVYVKPIIKTSSLSEFNKGDVIELLWEPYPNAAEYTVQVTEKESSRDLNGQQIFSWDQRPTTNVPLIHLDQFYDNFKSGFFYTYHVYAIDTDGRKISETDIRVFEYDFTIK